MNGTTHRKDDGFEVNCLNALVELYRVGIADLPVDLKRPVSTNSVPKKVDKWRDWWEEIKPGKRRFTTAGVECGGCALA